MKKSAVILSIEVNHTSREFSEYRRIRDNQVLQNTNTERISEDVWLIRLPQGVPFLANLVSVCEYASFKYKLLHIDHEPVWEQFGKQG